MVTDHPPVPHASTPPPGGDGDDTGTRRPQLTGIAAELTQWAAALDDADPMSQLLKETVTWVAGASQQIEWAEAEIEKASTGHPEYADDTLSASGVATHGYVPGYVRVIRRQAGGPTTALRTALTR